MSAFAAEPNMSTISRPDQAVPVRSVIRPIGVAALVTSRTRTA